MGCENIIGKNKTGNKKGGNKNQVPKTVSNMVAKKRRQSLLVSIYTYLISNYSNLILIYKIQNKKKQSNDKFFVFLILAKTYLS